MRAMASAAPIDFDVWGCRGSHNVTPAVSRVGNSTVCSSVLADRDLFVMDAGRGLLALGNGMLRQSRFRAVRRVHVLVSHAHLDHWEGLKDVDWFWRRDNDLEVTIYGTREALGAIRRGFSHPSYVPLEVLARGTTAALRFRTLRPGQSQRLGWQLETFPLHHYSGIGRERRSLDTIGFRLTGPEGTRIAYMCDHEPTAGTRATERKMLEGAHLAVLDAHFSRVTEQRFGHGSQEYAAGIAREHPGTLVLAAHLGPMITDTELRAARKRYAAGLSNYRLAREGTTLRWSAKRRRFAPLSRPPKR